MTSPRDEHHLKVPDTFRVWRFTTIYIAVAITVVVFLLLWDMTHGPIPHPPNICPR